LTATVRVLLVEDDAGDILMTQEALAAQTNPSEVHVARDGVEALAFLHEAADLPDRGLPDLVLLDLNLPRMDGREVLAEIRADAQLTHLPVVVLTTSSNEDDVAGSYRLHANAYVTKPVDYASFVGAVAAIERFFTQVAELPPHAPAE
jgi:CheY-like chemotaxis protein